MPDKKVYCRDCEFFNKNNLCNSVCKDCDRLTIYINKVYMSIVLKTGKCEDYKPKRKWYKFWR